MPANLIKLTTNGVITEFSPDKVSIIQLQPNSSTITITLTAGRTIDLITPSPVDAIVKLAQLETAMNSGTGIVEINDQNTAAATTTTTTSAGPSSPS